MVLLAVRDRLLRSGLSWLGAAGRLVRHFRQALHVLLFLPFPHRPAAPVALRNAPAAAGQHFGKRARHGARVTRRDRTKMINSKSILAAVLLAIAVTGM